MLSQQLNTMRAPELVARRRLLPLQRARPSGASAPASPPEAAPAAETGAALFRERRAGLERVIELVRWVVLIYAAVANNFPGVHGGPGRSAISLILGGWALLNLTATIMLLARRIPGPAGQLAMLGIDLCVAGSLVYLSGGVESDMVVAFAVVVIEGSLRFSVPYAMVCALTACVAYFGSAFAASGWKLAPESVDAFVARSFLLFVVTLTSSLLARELVTARDRRLMQTIELEHAAFAELREVDRIKSDFIMLASHELRTPLTKIKAWLTLMQDAADRLPAEAREEGLQQLRIESEHLARLTDNLLCIAQLESGEIRLKTAPVDLETVFHEVLSRFVATADQERFHIEIATDADRVSGDHDRLALVLACLLDNALKFSAQSEAVRVRTHRVVNRVHIEVQDNGRRIPEADVDRVFASFYQVESPLLRQRGGFGIGLYLARQLVERMGGKVWLDNRNVRGNTFVVALPFIV
jgi:signal transduction histidine kinase